MGCTHSLTDGGDPIHHLYPSAIPSDHDPEILALWNKFLRGECEQWKVLVATGESESKPPAVYWSDVFKNEMVKNISTTYPTIATELESRPIKVMAKILCSIMEFCLINIITDGGRQFCTVKTPEQKRQEQLQRIAKAHCKWQVNDAAYINVENAMMDALRRCLGIEFTPDIEVRLRYKYARVKRDIQKAQQIFETEREGEAEALRREADVRIEQIEEEKGREERARETEVATSTGTGEITGSNGNVCPMRNQYAKMTTFSVRDFNNNSSRTLVEGGEYIETDQK